jgi:hypothetical protein
MGKQQTMLDSGDLTPADRLRALKAMKWPEEGRDERIRQAKASWSAIPRDYNLTPEDLKFFAEDPDLEDSGS